VEDDVMSIVYEILIFLFGFGFGTIVSIATWLFLTKNKVKEPVYWLGKPCQGLPDVRIQDEDIDSSELYKNIYIPLWVPDSQCKSYIQATKTYLPDEELPSHHIVDEHDIVPKDYKRYKMIYCMLDDILVINKTGNIYRDNIEDHLGLWGYAIVKRIEGKFFIRNNIKKRLYEVQSVKLTYEQKFG
jgi:hypothetical protein